MNERTLLPRALGGLALLLLLAGSTTARAQTSTLQEVTSFGTNPTRLRMYVYRPKNVRARPPIVVASHYCHGDAIAFYNGSDFARLADQHGFMLIFPSVTQAGDGCFDVASPGTLTHDGGGDSLGIASMVRYAIQTYGGDATRVYATGVSSGAMMTEVLLGSYPDLFKAGAAFAGVPFACFAGPVSWSDDCAKGRIVKTAAEWGALVRAADPGYTGPRPRIQLWHGTSDEVLSYVDFGEAIEQWTNVLGVSQTPASTEPNTPQPGWTRTRYGGAGEGALVEAISMQGVPHNLPVQAAAAIHFFGLDVTSTDTQAPTTPTNLVATARTASTVTLAWSASTDDVGVTAYDVYAGNQAMTSVTGTTAVVSGLAPGTAYGLTVQARDAAGNVSARSAAVTATTSADTTPPAAPTLTVSEVSATSARLSWTAATDDVAVTLYKLYQQTSGGNVNVMGTNAAPASTVTGSLAPGTRYTYFMTAQDAAGNVSNPSAPVTFTTAQAANGTCKVGYTVNQWPGGFTASVTVTNTGPAAVNGWTLAWSFAAGQTVTQGWSAQLTQSGAQLTARNLSWNAVLPAGGGSATFGFQGVWTGSNPAPAAFTLDGVACSVN
jgi:acetylxylan esterase